MSGPASGVMAAACAARRGAGCSNLITYDMGGTSTDVGADPRRRARRSRSEIEMEYAMPIHVPMVDVRTDRRRRRLDRPGRRGRPAAGRAGERRRRRRGRSATAAAARGRRSPTPTCCSAGSNPARPAGARRRRSTSRRRATAFARDSAARSASTRSRPRRQPCCASPTTAWPARSAWSRSPAARSARLRAVRLRRRRAAARRGAGARARHPEVLIPARPGITNALGCIVADLRHDFVNTLNTPLARRRRRARSRTILAAQAAEGAAAIEERRRHGRAASTYLHAADMQFRGQTHLLRVPRSTAPRSAGEALQTLLRRGLLRALRRRSCRRSAPVLVNLQHLGHRRAGDDLDLSATLHRPRDRPPRRRWPRR